MRVIAIVAAVVMLAAGCSSENSPPAAAPTSTSTTPTEEPVEIPTPVEFTPGPYTADEVLAAFQAAWLPVRNPRDNSKNCEELGCLQLMTTDDVSIYTWGDSVPMELFAHELGKDAFVLGNVLLQYAGARTPEKMRPKYEAALTAMG